MAFFFKMMELTPITKLYEKTIEQKIIKNVNHSFISAFMLKLIFFRAKPRSCHSVKLTKEDLETTFIMAWDAIKL